MLPDAPEHVQVLLSRQTLHLQSLDNLGCHIFVLNDQLEVALFGAGQIRLQEVSEVVRQVPLVDLLQDLVGDVVALEEVTSLQGDDLLEGLERVKVPKEFGRGRRDLVPLVDFEESEAQGGFEKKVVHL